MRSIFLHFLKDIPIFPYLENDDWVLCHCDYRQERIVKKHFALYVCILVLASCFPGMRVSFAQEETPADETSVVDDCSQILVEIQFLQRSIEMESAQFELKHSGQADADNQEARLEREKHEEKLREMRSRLRIMQMEFIKNGCHARISRKQNTA